VSESQPANGPQARVSPAEDEVAEGRRLLNQRLRAEFVAGAEEDSHHGSGVA